MFNEMITQAISTSLGVSIRSTPKAGRAVSLVLAALAQVALSSAFAKDHLVCVSNERSGTVTIIDGAKQTVLTNLPVAKRPRGIHPSPDGKLLYVALSGRPISAPRRGGAKVEEDEDAVVSDHSADGIAIINIAEHKVLGKIPGGSDPEQFVLSPDGSRLYIANEDTATVTLANSKDGAVEHVFQVKKEPEGIALTPDGKQVYVTCETGGEILVIDTRLNRKLAEIVVGGRPRNVAFLPDGTQGFVPSESTGKVHVFDPVTFKVLKTLDLPPNSRPM